MQGRAVTRAVERLPSSLSLGVGLMLAGCAQTSAAPAGRLVASAGGEALRRGSSRGAAIFTGQGRCATRHGTEGQGTPDGPSLGIVKSSAFLMRTAAVRAD